LSSHAGSPSLRRRWNGEPEAEVVELVHLPAQERVVAVDVDLERRAHAAILARRADPLCAMRPLYGVRPYG
jgi:hypothetical protein